MVTDSQISTMDSAELVGYLGAFAVFLIGGILLVVFGTRRIMRRSAIRNQQQYAAVVSPQAPSPYGESGGYPYQPSYGHTSYMGQPNPYAPQQGPDMSTKKSPNLAISIVMIVLGVLVVLSAVSALAQAGSGTS